MVAKNQQKKVWGENGKWEKMPKKSTENMEKISKNDVKNAGKIHKK